jgi:hypothetical protein
VKGVIICIDILALEFNLYKCLIIYILQKMNKNE